MTFVLIILLGAFIFQTIQLGQCEQGGIVPRLTPVSAPTPWIKQDVLVKILSNNLLEVWTDNIKSDITQVNKIEGVWHTKLVRDGYAILVYIDPRYSQELISQEIVKTVQLAALDDK